MADKIELLDEELDDINGGQITYTWDGSQGTIGRNGNNRYKLLNKDAFIKYYNENKATMSEATIIKNLIAQGIAQVP